MTPHGIPEPDTTPYVFHKTAEVLPDAQLHTLGNRHFLLGRGNDVSSHTEGQYDIMLYEASDGSWWGEGGTEHSHQAPEEWAYIEPWPLVASPTGHINYAAPNQQLRGHILRPTDD